MAYIRLPLGIRIAMEFNLAGKVVVNVYHVTTTDPIVTVKLNEIAQVFIDWWTADLSTRVSEDIELFSVTALNLNVENGEKITIAVTPVVPGGEIAPAIANNVALVVSMKTDKTGRSFQGRTYLAGFSENAVTNNNISVAKASSVAGDYTELDADLDTVNANLVVGSFQAGGVPRVEGVATIITSFLVNTRVDTQRRRLPTV